MNTIEMWWNAHSSDAMTLLLWLGAMAILMLLACALEGLFFKPPKQDDKYFMREQK